MADATGWVGFLRGHPQFLKLWTAQSASSLGGAITTVAMPLTAVSVLHASPAQMGVLSALTLLPQLLLGPLAGVWVDRLPRRPVLVAADAVRVLALGAVPVLAALGALTVAGLCGLAFLSGTATLLADTAGLALIPSLVGRGTGSAGSAGPAPAPASGKAADSAPAEASSPGGQNALVRANSATMFSASVAGTAGPSVAGALAQGIGAPYAMAVNSAASLVAAVCGLFVKEPPRPPRPAVKPRLRAELAEGMHALFANPAMTGLTLSATIGAFSGALQAPLLVLFYVRDLHLSSLLVGLAITASGLASVAGALVAHRLSGRVGHGRAYVAGQLTVCAGGFATASATGSVAAALPAVAAGQLLTGFGSPLFAIQQRAIRQAFTPDELLGRVTGTWKFFVFGAATLGAALGGALGNAMGLRTTLLIGATGFVVSTAAAALSPLTRLRALPQPA